MASFEFKSGNFQPSGGEQALGGVHAEMHAPALAPTGAEAHALVGPPHALLPGIPGASEPISPLIQLIMRMPGHLGLLSSLFEAVQNMILPHVDVLGQLGHFDFSTLVGHGHVLTALSDHVPVDLSAMSTDPHILHSLQEGVAGGGHVGDLSKLQLHADTTASYTKSALNVSGTVDLNKPQFEGAGSVGKGSALAPPGISEVSPSNHLAGVQRIFSQKLFEGVAPPNASASMTSSVSSVPTSAPTSAPSSLGDLHASAQGFQPHLEAARAGGGITDGAVYGAPSADASSFGPSGGVSDTLGAKHVLGNSDVAPPSSNAVGGPEYSTPQEVAQPIGLKAKELSLASIDKVPAANHAPVTHLTHHMSPTKIAMTNAVQHSGAASGAQPAAHSAQAGAPHSTQTPSTHAVHDQIVHGQPHKVQYDDHARATASSGQPAQADAPANSQANAQPADATQTTDAPANPEAVESYTIRSGDCLWNIAKDHLGNAMRWQDIYKLNMDQIGSNPDLIHPGVNLHMPSDGQSIAQGVTDGGKYVVQSGDNLWNISSKLLGSGTKWGELYKLNADVIGNNPRLIMPGQELTLPGADSSHMLANAAPTQTAATAAAAPQAAGAPQVSAAPEAPAAPVAHAAPAPHDAYAAQAPDTSKILKVDATPDHVLTGPGGAQAADLDAAAAAASNVAGDKSIVSPSLAPDLSFLKRKV